MTVQYISEKCANILLAKTVNDYYRYQGIYSKPAAASGSLSSMTKKTLISTTNTPIKKPSTQNPSKPIVSSSLFNSNPFHFS